MTSLALYFHFEMTETGSSSPIEPILSSEELQHELFIRALLMLSLIMIAMVNPALTPSTLITF